MANPLNYAEMLKFLGDRIDFIGGELFALQVQLKKEKEEIDNQPAIMPAIILSLIALLVSFIALAISWHTAMS